MTKRVKLQVEATKTGKSVEWTIDGKKPKDATLHLPKDDGPHEIEFRLDDQTKEGLRFDCSYPFWVAENTNGNCPAAGVNTDQIEVIACETSLLTVIDKNSDHARTLYYQLNFVDGAGQPQPLDPEIRNGGGHFF